MKTLRVARDGTLWIVIGHDVMFLRPGQPVFLAADIQTSDGEVDFVEAPDGTLWLTDERLGARAVYVPERHGVARTGSRCATHARSASWGKLIDRDGTLWTGVGDTAFIG